MVSIVRFLGRSGITGFVRFCRRFSKISANSFCTFSGLFIDSDLFLGRNLLSEVTESFADFFGRSVFDEKSLDIFGVS